VTAAEAHVLLCGSWGEGDRAFKLALTELAVNGLLRVTPGTLRRLKAPEFAATGEGPDDVVLRSVWESVLDAQKGSASATCEDVLLEAYGRYGYDDWWALDVVGKELAARGLAELQPKRKYLFVKRDHVIPTPAGEEALRRLGQEHVPPSERALALLENGPRGHLVQEVWPLLKRMRAPSYEQPSTGGIG
jgi:hypothetical protein